MTSSSLLAFLLVTFWVNVQCQPTVIDCTKDCGPAGCKDEVLGFPQRHIEHLDRTTFVSCETVYGLFVQYNLLTIINASLISEMFPQLRILSLGSNRISSIVGTFNLPHLETLRLDHNQLRSLNTSIFGDLGSLQTFDLSSQFLYNATTMTTILSDPRWPDGTPKGLNTIAGSKFHLPELVSLDLSYNYRARVAVTSLEVPKLTSIFLQYNKIVTISPGGTLAQLTGLTNLDMSNNEITNVEDHSFAKLTNLQVLDLSSNYLTELNGRQLEGHTRILSSRACVSSDSE